MGRAVKWLCGVLGVVLLAVGGATAVLVGPQSVVRLPARVVEGGAPLLVTEPSLLGYRGTTAYVSAQSSSGAVFVGAGHPVDVTSYVAGASALRVQTVSSSGSATGVRTGNAGVATPVSPEKLTIWTAQAQGSGRQELVVPLTGQPLELLVLTRTGSTLTVGWGATLPGLFPSAVGLAVLGLVMVLLALVLALAGRRRRRAAGAAPPSPAEPEAGAEPASVGTTAPRVAVRRTRPVIGALVVAATLGGCISIPQPVASGTRPVTKVGLTTAETPAMLRDYDARNNAAIATLSRRYSLTGWDAADTGPTLAGDRYHSTFLSNEGKLETPATVTFSPQATWSNAFSSYPLAAVVRATVSTATTGRQPSSTLTLFTRASAASAWKLAMDVPLETGAPEAGGAGSASQADVTRAATLRTDVVAYLEKGTADTLTPSRGLVDARKELSVADPSKQEATRATSCQAATRTPRDSMEVVVTVSGVMALMTLRCTSTIVAKDGFSLSWQAPYARTLGVSTDPFPQLTRPYLVQVAVRRPATGKAVVMGATYGYVRPADAEALFGSAG